MRKWILVGVVAVAFLALVVGCQSDQKINSPASAFTAMYMGGTTYQVRAPDASLHMYTFRSYEGTSTVDHLSMANKVVAFFNDRSLARMRPGQDVARDGITAIGIDGHAEAAKLYGDPTLFTSFGLNQPVAGLEDVYLATLAQAEDLAQMVKTYAG